MRAKLEQIPLARSTASFLCFAVKKPAFEFCWHFHPEYELTLVTKGHGNRLVGDSIVPFGPGDMVLLGPMLPHTWVGRADENITNEAIVIQFPGPLMELLARFSEFGCVHDLLMQATSGLVFDKDAGIRLQPAFEKILTLEGTSALIAFLELLSMLAAAKWKAISHYRAHHSTLEKSTKRINTVLQHVEQHYAEPIEVDAMAAITHLSKSAFCKFFKKQLGKNFTAYLNEVRITRAMAMLLHGDQTIREIAFICGFENLSYFNRVFAKQMGMTPTAYRKAQG